MLIPPIINPYENGKCPHCGLLLQIGAKSCPLCSQKKEKSKIITFKNYWIFLLGILIILLIVYLLMKL